MKAVPKTHHFVHKNEKSKKEKQAILLEVPSIVCIKACPLCVIF